MRSCLLLLLACCLAFSGLVLPETAQAAVQEDLYASPTGTGSACTLADPCSLTGARDRVRELNDNMTGDIRVHLLDGEYNLDAPLSLTSEDSGTNGHAVIYMAADGAVPIFSGGRRITGWQLYDAGQNIYRAELPATLDTRQLYVDGVRAIRAMSDKSPNKWVANAKVGYTTPESAALADWHNPTDVEIVFLRNWQSYRCTIGSVSGTAITMKSSCWNNISSLINMKPTWIENAYELLDDEGEWYLDKTGSVDGSGTRKLYYKPRPAENMATAEVVAPVLQTLVEGIGTVEQPIRDIRFEGITFRYSTWMGPSGPTGYVAYQAGVRYENNTSATAKNPAAVKFKAARSIRLAGNVFERLGATGLDFELGSQDISIVGNRFEDLSGGAIMLGYIAAEDHHPTSPGRAMKNITVANNYIARTGVEYFDSIGIFATYVDSMWIEHNEIYDLPYSGISVGWGWGSVDAGASGGYTTPTIARNVHIAYNRIEQVGRVLHDTGGIYTLGAIPESSIHHNYVNGVQDLLDSRDSGIYLDEGTQGFEVYDNVTKQSYWGLNMWTDSIRNNILHDNYLEKNPLEASPIRNNGNNQVYDNTVVDDGNWPAAAEAIIDGAGLEAAYASVKAGAAGGTAAAFERHYTRQGDSDSYYFGLAQITSFTVPGQSCQARINNSRSELFICMPEGSSVTALTPTIGIEGASVSPASGVPQNFSSPVSYTVVGEDGEAALWTVRVVPIGAMTGPTQDTVFHKLNDALADVGGWGGNILPVSGGIQFNKGGVSSYAQKFGSELLEFDMTVSRNGWNAISLRSKLPNTSITAGDTAYHINFGSSGWELQKWTDGYREMLIGSVARFPPRWGLLTNTQIKDGQTQRIQVGAINITSGDTVTGVRLVLYVDGEKVFDVVDTVNPLTADGYLTVHPMSAAMTLHSIYDTGSTNVALNRTTLYAYRPDMVTPLNAHPSAPLSAGVNGVITGAAAQASGSYAWAYAVDLGQVYQVDKLVAAFGNINYATEYELLGSMTNQGDWVVLASKTNGVGARKLTYTLQTPKLMRYAAIRAVKPNGAEQSGNQMSVAEFEVYGVEPVSSIELSDAELALGIGETHTVTAQVYSEQTIKWISGNVSIAHVDAEGKITGVSAGTATVSAVSLDGSVSTAVAVTVNPHESGNLALFKSGKAWMNDGSRELGLQAGQSHAGGIDNDLATYSQASGSYAWTYRVDLGQTFSLGRLQVRFHANLYATDYRWLIWEEGDEWGDAEVIHPQQAGTGGVWQTLYLPEAKSARYVGVQALKPSVANEPGGQMSIAELGVFAYVTPLETITLDRESMTMEIGDQEQLEADVTPEDAEDKTIIWSSSDPTVATVSESGLVTAVSAGRTTIVAASSNGLVTDTVQVSVSISSDGNLALNRLAWAERPDSAGTLDFNPGAGAEKGVDGSTSSGFTQAKGSYAWKYVVDLGRPYAVDELAVRFGSNAYATEFELLGSGDGTNWQVLASYANGAGNTRHAFVLPEPRTVRYAAVKALKPNAAQQQGNQMGIIEFQVYGSPPIEAELSGAVQAQSGQTFGLTYGLNGVAGSVYGSVYAQEATFAYDPLQVEFVGAASLRSGVSVVLTDTDTSGEVRLVLVSLGAAHALATDGDVLALTWRAKPTNQPVTATIGLQQATVSDGSGREQLLAERTHTVQIAAAPAAPDKSALQALIAQAEAALGDAVEGAALGQYPPGSKAALGLAVAAASDVLNDSGATQTDVTQAVSALQGALTVFQNTVITVIPGDLNGDGFVRIGDLGILAARYGLTSDDPDWDSVKAADLNDDGVIDIVDLAMIAQLL